MAAISNSLVSLLSKSKISIYPSETEVIESLSYLIQDKIKESNEKCLSSSDHEYQNSEGWATTNIVKSKILNETPSSREIFSYIYDLSVFAKLNSECLAISYIYMTRFLKASKIMLSNSNWRETLLFSILLSQRVCSQNHMEVYDFILFLPQLDPTALIYKEYEFLRSFNYEYKINLQTFEVHYYRLNEIHHSYNQCIWLYYAKKVETAIKMSEWMTPDEDYGDLRKFVSISQTSLNLDELEDF